MNFKKTLSALVSFSIVALSLSSCNEKADSNSSLSSANEVTTSANSQVQIQTESGTEVVETTSDKVTDKDTDASWDDVTATAELSGDSITVSGSGATAEGSVLTISSAGTYVVSGTLTDGQIIVDADSKDDIKIVLNGADITCSDSAAIHVRNADKVIITLADGTENNLTDGTAYTYFDEVNEEPNACIYSKDDLTINGSGSLNITGNFNNGISTTNDLVLVGGNITVKAANVGIRGKDSVTVLDGSYTVTSGGDSLKSAEETDTTLGWIVINGGTFNLSSAQDGIQAQTALTITGGTFNITTTGAVSSVGNDNMGWGGGWEQQETTTDTTSDVSSKGIKSGGAMYISGGTFEISTTDHSVHCSSAATICGGDFAISSSSGKGISVHGDLLISGGTIDINKATEGIESKAILEISGGTIYVTASDDGLNAGGGVSMGGAWGGTGEDETAESTGTTHLITISGGYCIIDAGGDGIDSNGNIVVTGGTTIVNGPTNDGNGPLDCGDNQNSITVSGGVFIAAGSTGMMEVPSTISTQNCVYTTGLSANAGTTVTLADEEGNVVVAYKLLKQAQGIIISAPDIETSSSYSIYTGGTLSDSLSEDGYTDSGRISDASSIGTSEITSSVTAIGSGTVQGGMGGGGMMPPDGDFGGGHGGRR